MKRIIILLAAIVLLLSGCSKGDPMSSQSQSGNNDQGKTGEKPPVVISKNAINLSGHGNDKGYYYISDYKEDKKRNSYANIMYVDYATGKEVYLCSKANCKHDNNSCTSFLTFEESSGFIFTNNDKLYLFTKGSSTAFVIGENGAQSGRAPALYQMNADGNEKKKLYTLDSGYELSADDKLILLDNSLYCILEKNELVGDSNKRTIKSTDRKLICVDLSSGKSTDIQKIKSFQNVIGAYTNKMVLGEIKFKTNLTDDQIANESEYKRQLALADYVVSVCEPSGKVIEIASIPYKKCNNVMIYQNRAFYTYNGTTTIKYVDLDTKQVRTLSEGIGSIANIRDIFGGKLLCLHGSGNKVTSYFSVDYLTGEVKNINLFDKSAHEAVTVLADAGDKLLVVNGYVKKQNEVYKDQIEIIGYKYALISKADFFSGKANYKQIDRAK